MKPTSKTEYEFGGPVGTFLFICFSHLLVYYFWISLTYYQGGLFSPTPENFARHIVDGALPTMESASIYIGFMLFQMVIARFLPGLKVKGLPIPSEGGKQLTYLCNGIACWYVTLFTAFFLHFTGIFSLTKLADNLGGMITVGMIAANLLSLILYFHAKITKRENNPTGNFIYDFFMGNSLNPRFCGIDLKLFSEIRIPWILLFFLTLSAAAKQYEVYGKISPAMMFMILAHGLYTNACMKGEECIPTTWDIFYEKFGWMLIFWNYVGVPFVYCFQSFYILKNNPSHSTPFMAILFAVLIFAYYIWDTANSQKNRFRMQLRKTFIARKTFPQLPWGTLKNPKFLETKSGDPLLIDGWYKYARKIHYTADTTMALTWGLSCGFSGILPFFYPLFFMAMITHRYQRDYRRCAKKYGEDWKRYCEIVRYKFIPGIY